MEGVPALGCAADYRYCAGYPEQYLTVADACTQVKQSCAAVDATSCQTALDMGNGLIGEYVFAQFVLGCMQLEVDGGSTCADAYTYCASPSTE